MTSETDDAVILSHASSSSSDWFAVGSPFVLPYQYADQPGRLDVTLVADEWLTMAEHIPRYGLVATAGGFPVRVNRKSFIRQRESFILQHQLLPLFLHVH
jgi:hypothetical protein